MRAIVVTDEAAGTGGMTLVERPEPPAAINDVIVEIHASGFVPTEMAWPSTWTDRRGRDRTPSIPGHELAGVVSALGYGTTGVSLGQRVFGLADWHRDGTLAEYVAIEARNLAPLPGDVDFTVGASLPISGLTAWQGLFDHGHLHAGQSVLAHGAAGAVGTMVTQLAREAGAYVIGTGRAADRQKALDFGAHEFVDLDNDALEDVGGVDLVFDVIGGEIQKRSASLIRAGGTLVTVARAARRAARRRPDSRLRRRVRSRPTERDRPKSARRTTADQHRQRRDPRRRRRRPQPDPATQRKDDHPHSSITTRRRQTPRCRSRWFEIQPGALVRFRCPERNRTSSRWREAWPRDQKTAELSRVERGEAVRCARGPAWEAARASDPERASRRSRA